MIEILIRFLAISFWSILILVYSFVIVLVSIVIVVNKIIRTRRHDEHHSI
jgi:hypothetical protein